MNRCLTTDHRGRRHREGRQQTPAAREAHPGRGRGTVARIAISLVRVYQNWISVLKPKTCRYYPSCSEYAVGALAARGLLRGGLLAAWRVLRCNPFSSGGYDPGPWAEDSDAASGVTHATHGGTAAGGDAA